MTEWELTLKEINEAANSAACPLVSGIAFHGLQDETKAVAQAQAKKLVEWLETPCLMHLHGRNNPKETSKHCRLCSTCMRELHRQVGL